MTVPGRGGRRTPEPAMLLRGTPSHLTAAGPLPIDAATARAARLPGSAFSVLVEGAVPERVRVRAPRPGRAPELRVRLASSTPPGRYEGAATLGERTVSLVLEVEPAPRLRVVPQRIETTGTPSGSETVELRFTNIGNMAIEIPARSSFCLFDGSGIDHAMWAALATDPPKGKGRLDVLLDDLSASHGGLVDVRVRDGAGPIEPGEERACRVELGWSDRLRPGRRYVGAWEVGSLRVPIRVETPRDTPSAKPGARAVARTRRVR